MAWCEEHEGPKTRVLHKRTCRPYALIPRGRRPYHPSLKGTEDPRDVAKQNGSAAGRTRVATMPEGAGNECDWDLGPCATEGTCTRLQILSSSHSFSDDVILPVHEWG